MTENNDLRMKPVYVFLANGFEDIEALVRYAHLYGSKVFATVNTLLFYYITQKSVLLLLYNKVGIKEPVTENTKKVARCFYALEQDRADRKRYPAINPIDSYSKYVEYPEFQEYIAKRIEPTWLDKVNELKTRLQRGKEISEQINILGDDGVPVEYHVTFWKAELIDFVILQQDAFDEIDAVTPLERQEEIMNLVIDICHTEFKFEVFNEVMDYFKRMINIGKQMNYAPFKSERYYDYKEQMMDLLKERAISESVSKLLK